LGERSGFGLRGEGRRQIRLIHGTCRQGRIQKSGRTSASRHGAAKRRPSVLCSRSLSSGL
jgi:hypothetical protein